jgi:glycosyltransferase involved in cell wall biosynthesis
MIFDAIRVGTPFILTKENGISERVKDCAIFVDPLNKSDIVDKILWLSDPKNRDIQAGKIRAFKWVHSWKQIGNEIIEVWKKIK